MGTRGAVGWIVNGRVKAAYNHFDSYPTGLGYAVVDYCKSRTIPEIEEEAHNVQLVNENLDPTPRDVERWRGYTNHLGRGSTDWYTLTREAQGRLDIYAKMKQMPDGGHDFMKDSLFCEWAYLVNVDSGTLDIYRGFQTEMPRTGIFAGHDKVGDRYYPCKQIASFPLDDLPDMKEFEDSLYENEK